MLKLLVFPPALGVRNASPFCLKAQALLAMSRLPHRLEQAFPFKGPRGKLPVLIDGDTIIPDSALIQRHLALRHGVEFDQGLSPAQLGEAHPYRRLAEEHLYWVIVYSRFVDHAEMTRAAFFAGIPWPARRLVFRAARAGILAEMRGHGIGRHDPADIYAFGAADLDAIAARLGDRPFFFGDRPTSIDASLYGVLANIVAPPMETPLKAAALRHRALAPYVTRCDAAFFGRTGNND